MKLDQTAIDMICDGKQVVLDMADVDKEIFQDEESVLVLLRNLDTTQKNVQLDFSKTNFQQKEFWLLTYAKSNVVVEVDVLANAWASVASAMLCQQIEDERCNFLPGQELRQFISRNIAICADVVQLLHDLMLWSVAVATNTQYEAQEESKATLSANIMFAGKHIGSFDVKLYNAFKHCKKWSSLFIDENKNHIGPVIEASRMCLILFGKSTPEWNKFKSLFQRFYGIK